MDVNQALSQYLAAEHIGSRFLMRRVNIRFMANDLLDAKLVNDDILKAKLLDSAQELLRDQTEYVWQLQQLVDSLK